MKITYLKLQNFANIYTAMKSRTIEIDFTKSKNRIVLFTGTNGSGKTSILSCLHPFATNGNLDIRSENPLVTIGENGYKEIHLDDNGIVYVIKHYFTPSKETHSVKSYITRNGEELNPNGNVTSFKEIIKQELDIEPDYLKLTRLGSNVTNFIDLKTTDRKSFMGKILEEVEIYLKYYKVVTGKMREIKSVISHIIDKMKKLEIDDVKEFKKEQKIKKEEIDHYKTELDKLSNRIGLIDFKLNEFSNPLVIKEELDQKEKELSKINRTLMKKDFGNLSVEECERILSNLNDERTEYKINMEGFVLTRENLLNQMNSVLKELEEIQKELDKINGDEEIKTTEYMISELQSRIETRSKENHLAGYTPSYTKKELEDLIVMLDNVQDILYTTYECGQGPIRKAISHITGNLDISSYVDHHKQSVTKNKLQAMSEYIYNQMTQKLGMIKPDCNHSSTCKVMDFYNEICDMATESPDVIIEDESFVAYTKIAFQNIQQVLKNLREFKSTFEKLPKEIQSMFLLETVFDRMENLKPLYEKEKLYAELSLVTEYELYEKDREELKSLKEKLLLLKKSNGNIEYFEQRKETLEESMEDIKSSFEDMDERLSECLDKIKEKDESIELYKNYKESLETKDIIASEYNQLNDAFVTVKELHTTKKELTIEFERMKFQMEKLEKDWTKKEYNLQSYEQLSKDLKSYEKEYDEMTLLKSALSSKEGIPLLFIQVYLKNIQEITNELLDVVYDGELSIDSFDITSDTFSIPYTTKNTSIKDVSYASQGEKSFISLALSFALIYQSISNYNIMLLDELDSTLDTKNREKFLQILEKQMEMISSEQIFVISHNNMFQMYPIDVVDTKNATDTDNKLANYIPIQFS